jgi:hypothetical protein
MAQLQAEIRKAQASGEKLEAEAMAKRLEALYMSAQAAQVVAMAPGIGPVADEFLMSAGFQDRAGQPVLNQGAMPAEQAMQPMEQQIPEPMQADGGMQGIETMAPDGVDPSLQQ